jgi:hypothetical protein
VIGSTLIDDETRERKILLFILTARTTALHFINAARVLSVTLFLFCARAENDDRDRNAAVASSQTRVVASRFDERSFSSRRAFQTTPTSRFFFFAF